ncbi:Ser/Thr phosphatase [Methanocaldococcus villosus KIN24-T80]|uniref:Ser/Thr phosphatase n=1 Tax=Methanocaldococcus villosus KIN24-T80 TaxID=1069083 RepID=N6VR70_9EURY|nr:protein phosphatase 2C domain-containing protein [Methanocaldococcus villosus]ENN95631.1 Ser/Thr phosphatase [Methanocaldococcus villosus KIN24-T80]
MKVFGITHRGGRDKNEDHILIKKIGDIYLLAVADGLGGHNAGDIASKIAIEELEKFFEKNCYKSLLYEEIETILKEAFKKVHNAILNQSYGDREEMGTTLTSVVIKDNKAIIANCGDSRAYIIRDGKIIFKTKDHTYVQELIDKGYLSEEEAMYHPYKHVLKHALGIDFAVDIYKKELKSGDILLLSSDGLHDYVREKEILEVINKYEEPKDIVENLLKIALKKTMDNVSIIVFKVK